MSGPGGTSPTDQVLVPVAAMDFECCASKPSGALEPGGYFKDDIAANREA